MMQGILIGVLCSAILFFGRDYLWRKKTEILLSIFTCVVLLAIAEIVSLMILPQEEENRYGWMPPQNQTITVSMPDDSGAYRDFQVTHFSHGFSRWGNLSAEKTKLFIMGDSFTKMDFLPEGYRYYDYMQEGLPGTEFFVFGNGGYGSLQEYMVLNDTIEEIRPDYILWQFCGNDFINNLHSYESSVYLNNVRKERPYLEDGTISYKKPRPLWWLRKNSRFIDYALETYDDHFFDMGMKAEREKTGNSPMIIPEEQQKSLLVTEQIFRMVKNRTAVIPVIMFEACYDTPEYTELCSELNITCINGFQDVLKNSGLVFVNRFTGHWNAAGNRFVGEYLSAYLRNTTYLK
jgi:hypothetical protein